MAHTAKNMSRYQRKMIHGIRPAAPVQTMEGAVEMVKSVLGGTTDSDESCISWRNMENWYYEGW
jgi:hypothetical protein